MMKSLKGRGGLTHGRGMTESVRLLWVRSLHKCASVHSAVSILTDTDNTIDTQHVELGKSRVARDLKDLETLLEWFQTHNPFETSDNRLRSVASGLVVSQGSSINCDTAEEVGHSIMCKFDGVAFSEVVLKKTDRIKTLAVLKKRVRLIKRNLLQTIMCSLIVCC